MDVHVCLRRLPLQDLAVLVLADAAEERGRLVGLLDHPLGTATGRQNISQDDLATYTQRQTDFGEWKEDRIPRPLAHDPLQVPGK